MFSNFQQLNQVMNDHSKSTRMHLWMIQRARKEVFGQFLELGLLDQPDVAYCDSTECFPRAVHLLTIPFIYVTMWPCDHGSLIFLAEFVYYDKEIAHWYWHHRCWLVSWLAFFFFFAMVHIFESVDGYQVDLLQQDDWFIRLNSSNKVHSFKSLPGLIR